MNFFIFQEPKNQRKISSFFKKSSSPIKKVQYLSPGINPSDLSSSDVEIIEPTPENTPFKPKLKSKTMVLDDSDDFVPCTPMAEPKSFLKKSKTMNISKLSLNTSLNKKKSILGLNHNGNISNARKRAAEDKTGASPDPKKLSDKTSPNYKPSSSNNGSKKMLFTKLDCDKSIIVENEDDSFSLLEINKSLKDLNSEKLCNPDDTKSNDIEDLKLMPSNSRSSCSKTFVSPIKNLNRSESFLFDEDSLDEILSESLSELSPFKLNKKIQKER